MEEDGLIDLKVKTLDGKIYNLSITLQATVLDLKKQLFEVGFVESDHSGPNRATETRI